LESKPNKIQENVEPFNEPCPNENSISHKMCKTKINAEGGSKILFTEEQTEATIQDDEVKHIP
jgi:hypothetical protein